jgi:membrane protein implicated in regulation of membrane protease activity
MNVLKVAVIVLLVVLVVLLGIPLAMPMSGVLMCPECSLAGTWGGMCVALLASVVLLAQRRASRILVDRSRRPLLVSGDVLERPPRFSS